MVILVVEDESLINFAICDDLQRSGFEVISAYNADDAIAILETRPDITVVFTDIDMPGSMDGLKMAALARDRWPPLTIIITSGKRLPSELPERAVFMPKPYLAQHVVETIESLSA